jgi:protein TonB
MTTMNLNRLIYFFLLLPSLCYSQSAPGRIDSADTLNNTVNRGPVFPGGEEALNNYLLMKTEYPSDARNKGIWGKVNLTFTVTSEGKVTTPEILNGLSPSCDKEAIRVVMHMPDWQPCLVNGEPVDAKMNLSISFEERNGKHGNYFKRGVEEMRAGNYKVAIRFFDKALIVKPGDRHSLFNRGIAKLATENIPGACKDWQQAFEAGDSEAGKLMVKYCENTDTSPDLEIVLAERQYKINDDGKPIAEAVNAKKIFSAADREKLLELCGQAKISMNITGMLFNDFSVHFDGPVRKNNRYCISVGYMIANRWWNGMEVDDDKTPIGKYNGPQIRIDYQKVFLKKEKIKWQGAEVLFKYLFYDDVTFTDYFDGIASKYPLFFTRSEKAFVTGAEFHWGRDRYFGKMFAQTFLGVGIRLKFREINTTSNQSSFGADYANRHRPTGKKYTTLFLPVLNAGIKLGSVINRKK